MSFNELAADIAKNNAGEQEAIEGYYRLLATSGLPHEFIKDIQEIISDEMNHGEILSKWVSRITNIQPNKT